MIDPVAGLPQYRLGAISPLDLIDTSTYEFYGIAPPNAILSSISIGLGGFTADAAKAAFSANLERCVNTLAKRSVRVAMLNGLPLLLHLAPEQLALFRSQCADAGILPTNGLEAAIAAIKALGLTTVAVGNKWSPDLNCLLREALAREGIEIVGGATEPHTAEEVKGSFESGAALAYELACRADEAAPNAEAVYLAGGAWLTLHMIGRLENELGKPIITGQQSAHWYNLNVAGCYQPRTNMGALLARSLDQSFEGM